MKFYYSITDMVYAELEPSGTYWTPEEIRQIHLYAEDDPQLAELEVDEDQCIWPVHDCNRGFSWEPVECKDLDDAYEYLLDSENQSIYEYIHDI